MTRLYNGAPESLYNWEILLELILIVIAKLSIMSHWVILCLELMGYIDNHGSGFLGMAI